MDRIDKINEIQQNGIKVPRQQSVIVNNFFTIITIAMVCLSIIYYTNYIIPAQKEKQKREDKIKAHQKYLDKRAAQIALSHKLNAKNK
jgi:cell division protein FtsL